MELRVTLELEMLVGALRGAEGPAGELRNEENEPSVTELVISQSIPLTSLTDCCAIANK